ncbi:MAG: hypothetical protein ACI8R9_000280 [Paraglaciecola sp.]|jgi:hypothetical protein
MAAGYQTAQPKAALLGGDKTGLLAPLYLSDLY